MDDNNHNSFLNELRQIETLEAEAERCKANLLRKSGWQYSSAYVDYYWRWSKAVNDKSITTMNADEALRIEEQVQPCDDSCNHED